MATKASIKTILDENIEALIIFTYSGEVDQYNFRIDMPEAYRDAEVAIYKVLVGGDDFVGGSAPVDILPLLSDDLVEDLEDRCLIEWEGPEEYEGDEPINPSSISNKQIKITTIREKQHD